MSVIIGHFSDLHGDLRVLETNHLVPDLWISTGDIFPNRTRGKVGVEVPFQRAWFASNAETFRKCFFGKPVLVVNGNHDFVDLGEVLQYEGVWARTLVAGRKVELFDNIFAGFPEILYIDGEWNYETHPGDFTNIVEQTLETGANVLITHSPPKNVLDRDFFRNSWGIGSLKNMLEYSEHSVKHHFFGHVHECGGHTKEEMGIKFYNSSGKLMFTKI